MERRVDHAQEAIDAIDRVLDCPPPSIQDSLADAVRNGRMTIKEAGECLEAYIRCFHREEPHWNLPPEILTNTDAWHDLS